MNIQTDRKGYEVIKTEGNFKETDKNFTRIELEIRF